MTLGEYLRTRGLYLEPLSLEEDPVVADEQMLKEAADLWENKQRVFRFVIQARINAIGKQILEKAPPEEVLVLRQALVEVGAIISDFEKYLAEQKRRDAQKDSSDNSAPPKAGETL